jgi:hypothetical protein
MSAQRAISLSSSFEAAPSIHSFATISMVLLHATEVWNVLGSCE